MKSTDQSGGEGAKEFVWDGSMDAEFIAAMNAEVGSGGTSATPAAGEHVHGPGCDHSHQENATPDLADLEANLIEVAHELQARFGSTGPTPQEEKEFMREWLAKKGRTQEEVEAILAD